MISPREDLLLTGAFWIFIQVVYVCCVPNAMSITNFMSIGFICGVLFTTFVE